MRTGIAAFALLIAAATPHVFTPLSAQTPPVGPTFEVVSIKKVVAGPAGRPPLGSSVNQRPDGGLTMTSVPVGTLIARAYPPATPIEMVGLPGWAISERYDVSATSSLSRATPEDRTAMLRAMLADRFKLAVHVENREQSVLDLVPARRDGRLGPGITAVDIDCARIAAERAAETARNADAPALPPQFPDFNAPPPPCTLRSVAAVLRDRQGDRLGRLGDLLEGEATMATLAGMLRMATGQFVVDKTGLPGSYRVTMNYDGMASRRGPDVAVQPDAAPSVFTAIQEQLGLKLESSRAEREMLVIDHLERPTEN